MQQRRPIPPAPVAVDAGTQVQPEAQTQQGPVDAHVTPEDSWLLPSAVEGTETEEGAGTATVAPPSEEAEAPDLCAEASKPEQQTPTDPTGDAPAGGSPPPASPADGGDTPGAQATAVQADAEAAILVESNAAFGSIGGPDAGSAPVAAAPQSATAGAGAGRGGGAGRRPSPVMSKLQKEITGQSPEDIASQIGTMVAALASSIDTAKNDVEASASSIAANIDTWLSTGESTIDSVANGIDGRLAGLFESPKGRLDAALLDTPDRLQAAKESALAQIAAAKQSVDASIDTQFDGVHSEAQQLGADGLSRVDQAAQGAAGIRALGAQKAGEARSIGSREAEKYASKQTEDETEKAKNTEKASVANAAGSRAASAIQSAADRAATEVTRATSSAKSAVSSEASNAEMAWKSANEKAHADLGTLVSAAESKAESEAARVEATVESGRVSAQQTLTSAEQALKPTLDTEVTNVRGQVQGMAETARAELPAKAEGIVAQMGASLAAVQANCEQIKSVSDPEQARSMLDELRSQIDAAKDAAQTALTDEATKVQDAMQAAADGLSQTVDDKITTAQSDAEAAVSQFETTGAAEVAAYETAMGQAGASIELEAQAKTEIQLETARTAISTARGAIDQAVTGLSQTATSAQTTANTTIQQVLSDLPKLIASGQTAITVSTALGGDLMGATEALAVADSRLAQEKARAAAMAAVNTDALQGRLNSLVTAGGNGALTVEALRSLDQAQMSALKAMYEERTGHDLLADLQGRLDGAALTTATAYLEQGRVAGALQEIVAGERTLLSQGMGVADPKTVQRALGQLSAAEIDEVRKLAESDPNAAQLVSNAGEIFDQSKDKAERADQTFKTLTPELLATIKDESGNPLPSINTADPQALAGLNGAQLTALANNVGYDVVMSMADRNGVDPASLEGARYAADPLKDEKDAARLLALKREHLMIDRFGGEGENGERSGGRLAANSFFSGAEETLADAEVAERLDKKIAQMDALMGGGDVVDPGRAKQLMEEAKELESEVQKNFNSEMDDMKDQLAKLEVARDVTTFAAKKVAWTVGFVKSGGNMKMAGVAESAMDGTLKGVGTFADNYILEDVDALTAAQWGVEDASLTAAKGATAAMVSGGNPSVVTTATNTAFDVAMDVNKSDREHEYFSKKAMEDGSISEAEMAKLEAVAPDMLRLQGSIVKNAVNNTVSTVLDVGAGENPLNKAGTGILSENANQLLGGTVDNMTEARRDARRAGKDVDWGNAFVDATDASSQKWQDNFSLWGNVIKPGAEGYASEKLQDSAKKSVHTPGVMADNPNNGWLTNWLNRQDGPNNANAGFRRQAAVNIATSTAAEPEHELDTGADKRAPALDPEVAALAELDRARMNERGAAAAVPGAGLDLLHPTEINDIQTGDQQRMQDRGAAEATPGAPVSLEPTTTPIDPHTVAPEPALSARDPDQIARDYLARKAARLKGELQGLAPDHPDYAAKNASLQKAEQQAADHGAAVPTVQPEPSAKPTDEDVDVRESPAVDHIASLVEGLHHGDAPPSTVAVSPIKLGQTPTEHATPSGEDVQSVSEALRRGDPLTSSQAEILVKEAVDVVRTALVDSGKSLESGNDLRGLCGMASTSVAEQLRALGVDNESIAVHQAKVLFGGEDNHAFTVVNVGGHRYLIDTTARQFFGDETQNRPAAAPGAHLASNAPDVAQNILARGYVELDPKNAEAYSRAFGSEKGAAIPDFFDPGNVDRAIDERISGGHAADVINAEFDQASSASTHPHEAEIALPGTNRPRHSANQAPKTAVPATVDLDSSKTMALGDTAPHVAPPPRTSAEPNPNVPADHTWSPSRPPVDPTSTKAPDDWRPVGDGLEQSRFAWRDPVGKPEDVIVADYENDPGMRRMIDQQAAYAATFRNREERLRAIAEAPRKLDFGLNKAKDPGGKEAWLKRYNDAGGLQDLGDSEGEAHFCRENAIYTHGALAKSGEESQIVFGRMTFTDTDGTIRRVPHAWVELDDGTIIDSTNNRVHSPGATDTGLVAAPNTKEPMRMFRPAGGGSDPETPNATAPRRKTLVDLPAVTDVDGLTSPQKTEAMSVEAMAESEASGVKSRLSPRALARLESLEMDVADGVADTQSIQQAL